MQAAVRFRRESRCNIHVICRKTYTSRLADGAGPDVGSYGSAAERLAGVQAPQHHSGRPGGRPGPRGAAAPLSVRLRRGVLAARNGGGEACQDGGLRIRARSSLSRGHAGALGPAAGAPFG
ncbi:hypothetical protein IscW_ISCW016519 [Ixodes scapularis]|uniref:Uncharacterized protein n=1 Tax=Ixodes scapularis TaxID=6945 RepID=B7P6D9_IXOSC|nr:hypothetical protein IscW_ISCW016519 [Ixodes scapularis]|eukprot:XP_002408534.1 hypothetical protein IscW_ISCW016519 [Ixodes scapularis]